MPLQLGLTLNAASESPLPMFALASAKPQLTLHRSQPYIANSICRSPAPAAAMSRVMQGDRQDWDPVVIRKKKPTAAQSQSSGAVNAVRLPASDRTCRGPSTWSTSLRP